MYAENILDHFQNPRHKGKIEVPTISVEEANPLCGDKLSLDLIIENGSIKGMAFSGSGCAISQASMSMVAEELNGKSLEEAEKLSKDTIYELLGVPISPARVKCALLSYALVKKSLILLKHQS